MITYDEALYKEILKDDETYSFRKTIDRKKNARRQQRKAKQAQRNRYYDTF